jgi:hypothetical protein
MVAARYHHLLRHLPLSLEDGCAEVAAAHGKLDGDVAFLSLSIDKGSAGAEFDVCDFAER